MKKVIGIDVGGTYIRGGIVSGNKITSRLKINTEAKKGRKAVIKNILDSVKTLHSKDIAAIGLGVPGLVDVKRGVVKYSPNLPLKGADIKKLISKTFRKPVFVDNDANCFALSELIYGAGRGKKNIIGITLGTGIGGGIIIGGKLYYGRGNAGELGHMTINFDGPKSKCGNDGCVESYASIRGIIGRAKGLDIENPRELFGLAEDGDKKALKLWDETGFYLGVAIANYANIFDPDVIVLGGNISKAWKFFYKNMNLTIKKKALVKDVKVAKSRLGDDSGVLGAAALCLP